MCPEDFEKSQKSQRETVHVVAPRGASTCRSKGPKDEWIERPYDYGDANGSLKGKILQMEVIEDFESRPHKAVSFCGRKKERNKGMERAGAAEGAAWSQRRKVATKEKGREKGMVDEDGEERRFRGQSVQEVVAGIKEKESVHDGAKDVVQRPVGKVSCEDGIARRLKMKKTRKAGEKETKWQHSGKKSNIWRRSWNEEGLKEKL